MASSAKSSPTLFFAALLLAVAVSGQNFPIFNLPNPFQFLSQIPIAPNGIPLISLNPGQVNNPFRPRPPTSPTTTRPFTISLTSTIATTPSPMVAIEASSPPPEENITETLPPQTEVIQPDIEVEVVETSTTTEAPSRPTEKSTTVTENSNNGVLPEVTIKPVVGVEENIPVVNVGDSSKPVDLGDLQ